MSAYGPLADWYDALTWDVPYDEFADFYEKLLSREGKKSLTLLDLCCGTGTLTCIMAERGHELIGVDSSADMLAMAQEKLSSPEMAETAVKPMFLCQDAAELDLRPHGVFLQEMLISFVNECFAGEELSLYRGKEHGRLYIHSSGPDGSDRFDGNPKPHYHFLCNGCGRVIDLMIEPMNHIDVLASAGFDGIIEGHTILFNGKCESYKNSKNY